MGMASARRRRPSRLDRTAYAVTLPAAFQEAQSRKRWGWRLRGGGVRRASIVPLTRLRFLRRFRKPNRVSDGDGVREEAASVAPRSYRSRGYASCSRTAYAVTLPAAFQEAQSRKRWGWRLRGGGVRRASIVPLTRLRFLRRFRKPNRVSDGDGVWWRFAPRLTALGLYGRLRPAPSPRGVPPRGAG
jgi:hypothetical protein